MKLGRLIALSAALDVADAKAACPSLTSWGKFD